MFENPVLFILRIPVILLALTFHEFAHGWVAYRLGDTTAKDEGRLTMNPFSHLDIFGAIMLMFGPFGWAKPVPVNGYNLKNPKRDLLLISLAGPVSNIILALIFGYLLRFAYEHNPSILGIQHLGEFLSLSVLINIGISFFNLIPVPPLDGSKILLGLMPNSWIPGYLEKSRYLPTIFMGLMIIEWGFHVPVFSTIMDPLYYPFNNFWHFIIFGKA